MIEEDDVHEAADDRRREVADDDRRREVADDDRRREAADDGRGEVADDGRREVADDDRRRKVADALVGANVRRVVRHSMSHVMDVLLLGVCRLQLSRCCCCLLFLPRQPWSQ